MNLCCGSLYKQNHLLLYALILGANKSTSFSRPHHWNRCSLIESGQLSCWFNQ